MKNTTYNAILILVTAILVVVLAYLDEPWLLAFLLLFCLKDN
ncbi:MAG: hypothetical protein VYC55_07990 [Pseudomonadota bacterium]|nr:hypothetical protein [Pseudomonadota bacterium]